MPTVASDEQFPDATTAGVEVFDDPTMVADAVDGGGVL